MFDGILVGTEAVTPAWQAGPADQGPSRSSALWNRYAGLRGTQAASGTIRLTDFIKTGFANGRQRRQPETAALPWAGGGVLINTVFFLFPKR